MRNCIGQAMQRSAAPVVINLHSIAPPWFVKANGARMQKVVEIPCLPETGPIREICGH